VVGEAATGVEAVSLAGSLEPDLVLMDLQMPELDGVAATARVRDLHPDVHVLVLTTYDTDADITRAIEAGAIGYLLKDAPRDDLFAGVRSAARGESVMSPAVATRVLGKMRAPGEEALSAREIEVLAAVATGMSNKQIARQLRVSGATVKTHLPARLRQARCRRSDGRRHGRAATRDHPLGCAGPGPSPSPVVPGRPGPGNQWTRDGPSRVGWLVAQRRQLWPGCSSST
jgi:DNA-binding NarL/FixJ family response regulator